MSIFEFCITAWVGMVMFWLCYLTTRYIYLHDALIETMVRHQEHLEEIYEIIKGLEDK